MRERQNLAALRRCRRHENVVRLLLGCSNVNVDSKGGNDYTPLYLAVLSHEEGVVRLITPRSEIGVHSPAAITRSNSSSYRPRDPIP